MDTRTQARMRRGTHARHSYTEPYIMILGFAFYTNSEVIHSLRVL